MNPEQIVVTIPAQEWDVNVYIKADDCYLTREIKKLYPEAKLSKGNAFRWDIKGNQYFVKNLFSEFYSEILIKNFAENKPTNVTLIKQNS